MAVDEFGLLSAIWILSCNDQISYMTYQGLTHRLGLPIEYDVRSIIARHGELFRPTVPNTRLDEWKQAMVADTHLPSWIREKTDPSERLATINALQPDDLFRNQFRAEANAPPADLEIIKWGLDHIERLRSAQAQLREEKIKKWTSMRIPLLSVVVGLAAVLTGAFLQWASISTQRATQAQTLEVQRQLKYYEVELKPKLEGYSSLMTSMNEASKNADQGVDDATSASFDKANVTFSTLEPFLTKSARETVRNKMISYFINCNKLMKDKSPKNSEAHNQARSSALNDLYEMQDRLFEVLFPQ